MLRLIKKLLGWSILLIVLTVLMISLGSLARGPVPPVSADFQRFVESGRNDLYTYYPELIDRIAQAPEVAERVKSVHLSGPQCRDGRFSAIGRLSGLKELHISYGSDIDAFMLTLNQFENIRRVELSYTDLTDAGLARLDNPQLSYFHVHDYAEHHSPQVIKEAQRRMPNCQFVFSADPAEE